MWQFGVDQIFVHIQHAGWSLVYVIIAWLVIYLLNTLAWRLALGKHGSDVSFSKLFTVTVSGFVLNYITPFIAFGGEPYKIKALSGGMDKKQSFSAVVLYRMVHLLGHMLLLLTGILAALAFLTFPFTVNIILLILGCLITGVIALTFSGHRHGVFERFQRIMSRIPVLQNYESTLREMDVVITDVYRRERSRFYLAIVIEYLSRVCMGIEVYLILNGAGVETTIVSAMFIYVVYSIIINILFFIPLNIGAREGGLYLGLETLALPPLLGVYLGVVIRVREFFWIMLGLLFILLAPSNKETSSVNI